ncbi:MAG: hypothetical protein JWR09_2659 [Mucilaginibacter sp.]|nr:hypothetical protein [Mucilaginibacter sp.]
MNNTLKSIWAILAGFIVVIIISTLTDLVLQKTGIMKLPYHLNAWWFIVIVIIYRTVYGIGGCYLTAALAPAKPMLHVFISGVIGVILSIIGLLFVKEPPLWYPATLVILALPTALFGGYLRILKTK